MNVISILEISKAKRVNQLLMHLFDPYIRNALQTHFITKLSTNTIL